MAIQVHDTGHNKRALVGIATGTPERTRTRPTADSELAGLATEAFLRCEFEDSLQAQWIERFANVTLARSNPLAAC